MKKYYTILLFTAGSILCSCSNRNADGNTDTNNTDASKKYTDSTRGPYGGDTLLNDTLNKSLR